MNKISYSQYSMWANCPKAWQLKYIDGHKIDDTSIHTIFGTAMHEVIQEWLHTLYNESEIKAKTIYLHDTLKEKLLTLFKQHTTEDSEGNKTFLADKKTLMEFYQHGCDILTYVQTNYKKLFPTANTKLYAIEYELDIEVRPGVQYVGYIDIVTHNTATNRFVLYDLKTSSRGWTQAQKSDPTKINQLLLYKRFFAQKLGIEEKSISVEFIILKRTISESADFVIPRVSKFEPPNGPPTMRKMWDSFSNFVNTAFDESGNYITEQTAKPSKEACRWCKFRDRKDLCSVGK